MAASGERRWSRASYPLQQSTSRSVDLSPAISAENHARNSTASQLWINRPSSRQSLEDVLIHKTAPGAASIPRKGGANPLLPSPETPQKSLDQDCRDADFRDRGTRVQLMSPSEPQQAKSTSIPFEEYQQSRNSDTDQSGARKRTLRRISGRIESPIPAAAGGESLVKTQQNGSAQSPSPPGTSSWKQQQHPSQSISSYSSTQHAATPSSKNESVLAEKAYWERVEDHHNGSSGSRAGPIHPVTIGLTTSVEARPSSWGSSEDNKAIPTRRSHDSSQVEHGSRQGHQHLLQTPASIMSLRNDSVASPPLLTVTEADAHQSVRDRPNAHLNKAWHHQTYPLQAPASNANLREDLIPLPSPTTETVKEPCSRLSQHQSQAAIQSKSWDRQTYPLQAPASSADLRVELTPPPSPEKDFEEDGGISAGQTQEDSRRPSGHTSCRRQVYPLQSAASHRDFGISSSALLSPPREQGSQDVLDSSSQLSRRNELATKVVNRWARQTYPLQSDRTVSPYEPTPSPQQPEEENEHVLRALHLPKNISAVTDAEKHIQGNGRTIVVCLDGTGDKFDNDNSNIVHLISALKKDDARQVTYYQAGVGTYGAGGLSGGVTAALDMAIGSSLGLHVRDAYHFLMHTYKEGDKICIFGFSRGAYTARCLAGMIHKVGLLPPRNIQQISFAYEFYANDTAQGWKQSSDFKKTFCIDICVYFLGCFDSVASVGFIPRQLPLSSTPMNKPRYFRHAMALDERRAKFKVCRHQERDWNEINPPSSASESTISNLFRFLPNRKAQDDAPPPGSPLHESHENSRHGANITDEEHERLTAHEAPFDTDVLEVWFAGAHADIGGGAVPNDERHKLAQIPLRWMIRQAFECDTGILFKTAVLAEYGLDVHTLWPKYTRLNAPAHGPPPSFVERYANGLPPRHVRCSKLVPIQRHEKGEQFFHLQGHTDEDWTPEQVEDFYDALSELNDQLIQAPTWWILEVLPIQYSIPSTSGEFSTRTGMNLGRYRDLEEKEPKLHWTALYRAQHAGHDINERVARHTQWRTVV